MLLSGDKTDYPTYSRISSSGLSVQFYSSYGSGFRPDAFTYINLSNVKIKELGYSKLYVGPCKYTRNWQIGLSSTTNPQNTWYSGSPKNLTSSGQTIVFDISKYDSLNYLIFRGYDTANFNCACTLNVGNIWFE